MKKQEIISVLEEARIELIDIDSVLVRHIEDVIDAIEDEDYE